MDQRAVDLSNRVIVVTGATSGIGLETARGLARMGATLALVARDPARSSMVERRLRTESGNPRIQSFLADLSRMAEVRRLANELLGAYPEIHVLVNNAGALFLRRELTAEGIERTWALNVLSPFLLTQLLLERLAKSAPARVVNVASAAHERGRMRFDDLEGAEHYSGYSAYSDSKLALILWTYELARRLAGRPVTANALHPGFVATRFGQNNSGVAGWTIRLLEFLFAVRPSKGARTPIYLSASPEVEGVTGAYFVRERPAPSTPASHSTEDAQTLWWRLAERAQLTA